MAIRRRSVQFVLILTVIIVPVIAIVITELSSEQAFGQIEKLCKDRAQLISTAISLAASAVNIQLALFDIYPYESIIEPEFKRKYTKYVNHTIV
jgi:hypothetical protein